MFDAELGTGIFEGMSPNGLSFGQGLDDKGRGRSASTRCGEVGAVVGQDDVDLVGNSFDQMAQEIASCAPLGLAMKFDEDEFARSIDGDEHVELAFGALHLGDIDVEEADRIALELGLDRLSPSISGRRLMPWRCRQRCKDERVSFGIEGCSAYRQSSSGSKVCLRKATTTASSSIVSTVEEGVFGPVGMSATEVLLFHLPTVF